jgi:hypothetical protein
MLEDYEEKLLDDYLSRIWAVFEKIGDHVLMQEGQTVYEPSIEDIRALLPSAMQLLKELDHGF